MNSKKNLKGNFSFKLNLSKIMFITIIAIVVIIFLFNAYKKQKYGNNVIIKDKETVEDYILNINSYEAKIQVTITSNKNENTYSMIQKVKSGYSYQEIINGNESSNDDSSDSDNSNNSDSKSNLIIEKKNNQIIIKNNYLMLEKIYEEYDYVMENMLFLDTFVDEYKNSDNKSVTENDEFYIVNIKLKKYKNKYVAYKTLYISKEKNKIEKLEIKDINKNRTIYILYKEITINDE